MDVNMKKFLTSWWEGSLCNWIEIDYCVHKIPVFTSLKSTTGSGDHVEVLCWVLAANFIIYNRDSFSLYDCDNFNVVFLDLRQSKDRSRVIKRSTVEEVYISLVPSYRGQNTVEGYQSCTRRRFYRHLPSCTMLIIIPCLLHLIRETRLAGAKRASIQVRLVLLCACLHCENSFSWQDRKVAIRARGPAACNFRIITCTKAST